METESIIITSIYILNFLVIIAIFILEYTKEDSYLNMEEPWSPEKEIFSNVIYSNTDEVEPQKQNMYLNAEEIECQKYKIIARDSSVTVINKNGDTINIEYE